MSELTMDRVAWSGVDNMWTVWSSRRINEAASLMRRLIITHGRVVLVNARQTRKRPSQSGLLCRF